MGQGNDLKSLDANIRKTGMKKEDLKKLGLTDEQIDAVFVMHGKDVETHKTKITEMQGQLDTANNQLTEANTTIEGFKKLKPEELQAAADDYKAKWEQAQKDSAAQVAQLKFDHALEGALMTAKVKNIKTVLPLLNREKLILQDDGTITGLDDQLKPIKEKEAYLFSDTKEPPRIVTTTQTPTVPDKGTFAGAIQERLNSQSKGT